MIVWATGVAGDSFWAMVDLAGCALDLLPTGRTDEIGWQGSAEFVNRAVSRHVVNTNSREIRRRCLFTPQFVG